MTNYTQPELLRLIADAQERRPDDWWREFEEMDSHWVTVKDPDVIFRKLREGSYKTIRPKPRRRYAYCQDGTEVSWPEPTWVEPLKGELYYTPKRTPKGFVRFRWHGWKDDYWRLKAGCIHLTPKAAREHRDAEVRLAGGTVSGGEDE
jgi:hypothetical protein